MRKKRNFQRFLPAKRWVVTFLFLFPDSLTTSHNQDVSVSSGEKLSSRCHKVDESLAAHIPVKVSAYPTLSPAELVHVARGRGRRIGIPTYPTLLRSRLAARRTESRQCLDPVSWTLSNHAGQKWRDVRYGWPYSVIVGATASYTRCSTTVTSRGETEDQSRIELDFFRLKVCKDQDSAATNTSCRLSEKFKGISRYLQLYRATQPGFILNGALCPLRSSSGQRSWIKTGLPFINGGDISTAIDQHAMPIKWLRGLLPAETPAVLTTGEKLLLRRVEIITIDQNGVRVAPNINRKWSIGPI